ncbi:hypothetical protein [Frisingicoccus sp.]|jgi:hypothetical protein|uniref:hypothetical protein n=1 Tax=Frisingicoccus sp. TaxID=1918627 RepID=UPI0030226F0C
MNPSAIMKIMNAKNKFVENHPKFTAFLSAVYSRGIDAGTIIEITVTKPGTEPITSNIRVQESDLELLRGLQNLGK